MADDGPVTTALDLRADVNGSIRAQCRAGRCSKASSVLNGSWDSGP